MSYEKRQDQFFYHVAEEYKTTYTYKKTENREIQFFNIEKKRNDVKIIDIKSNKTNRKESNTQNEELCFTGYNRGDDGKT